MASAGHYPRVDQDLIDQPAIASSSRGSCTYGLCMEECPDVGAVIARESVQVRSKTTVLPSSTAGGQSEYLPSCLRSRCSTDAPMTPTRPTGADDRCAFPQCDGVTYAPMDGTHDVEDDLPKSLQCKVTRRLIEQLAPMTGGTMARSIGSVAEPEARRLSRRAERDPDLGLAVPIAGFIGSLLRLFAKTFTYVMIIAIGCGARATLYATSRRCRGAPKVSRRELHRRGTNGLERGRQGGQR